MYKILIVRHTFLTHYSLLFIVPMSTFTTSSSTRLYDTPPERGVSVDQDGKSNVWAIEPKMEVDTKSSEEKTGGLLVGGAAFAAFAVGAGFVLTHLPDPNQF